MSMKQILITIMIACAWFSMAAQPLKSDKLYAQGVELYQAGKYKEAIPIFIQCDSLDKLEMKSTDARLGNACMWLASCYYKSGDDLEAIITYQHYMLPPVDRRKTATSDALTTKAVDLFKAGKTREAIQSFIQVRQMELQLFDDCHFWPGNTSDNIATLLMREKENSKALPYMRQSLESSLLYRGTFNSSTIERAHQLLELYGKLHRSGFYDDIQGMLNRCVEKAGPDIKHDLQMELAYVAWKKKDISDVNCHQKMEEAIKACGRQHGELSLHYCEMLSIMTSFLCRTGNYKEAMQCYDRAIKRYDEKSMTHRIYQILQRDRMVILLGLGKIEEAGEIARRLAKNCRDHCFAPKDYVSIFDNDLPDSLFSQASKKQLSRYAWKLIYHQLPSVCPTDEQLVEEVLFLSPLHSNIHLQSVLAATYFKTMLLSCEEIDNEIWYESRSPLYEMIEKMPDQLKMYSLRAYMEAGQGRLHKQGRSFQLRKIWHEFFKNENKKEKISADGRLNLAILMAWDGIPINALPVYEEYLSLYKQEMGKPLDQLTPDEQRLRHYNLLDSKLYTKELSRFEEIHQKYPEVFR